MEKMKTVEELELQKKRLKKRIKKLDEQIDNIKKRTAVICGACKKGFEIQELTYIQTHWYDSPYGHTGGDRWYEGEGQWQCLNCKSINRLYNKPEIEQLKNLFKDIKDVYNK